MTGWNMPPGCNVSDIPGNGTGDDEMEAFINAFVNKMEEHFDVTRPGVERKIDDVAVWLCEKLSEAYAKGYADGSSEAKEELK